ncbi:MAG: hypothetical protein ACOC2W_01350 [bacterium]
MGQIDQLRLEYDKTYNFIYDIIKRKEYIKDDFIKLVNDDYKFKLHLKKCNIDYNFIEGNNNVEQQLSSLSFSLVYIFEFNKKINLLDEFNFYSMIDKLKYQKLIDIELERNSKSNFLNFIINNRKRYSSDNKYAEVFRNVCNDLSFYIIEHIYFNYSTYKTCKYIDLNILKK